MHKVVINKCYGIFNLSIDALQWLMDVHGLTNEELVSLQRHDPRLIECVETLGEKVNGPYSYLKIVEINGRIYKIDNYDGKEEIIEPDDINWIIINPNE